MIARFLIIGILVVLLLIIVRKITNFLIEKLNFKNVESFEQHQSILVKCSKCGAMVPKEHVYSKGEQTFYCKEHSNEDH